VFILIDDNNDDSVFELKVFGSDDPNIKIVSELMANKTSRRIIELLSKRPMYKNEIVKELNLTMALVDHHVKKMVKSNLLIVSQKKLIRKGKIHNFFKMTDGILILPTMTIQDIKDKDILNRIFKKGVIILPSLIIGWILHVSLITYSDEPKIMLDKAILKVPSVDLIDTSLLILIFGLLIYIIKKKN
jgi:DNA-binding transcriptional ArsR family regulator